MPRTLKQLGIPDWPTKKYSVIYADPPWMYDNAGVQGNAHRHYKLMPDCWIKDLPVHKISNDNCILMLWTTSPKMDVAMEVISRWGFKYKTVGFCWVKTYGLNDYFVGTGFYTRPCIELCLLATRGSTSRMRKDRNVRQLVIHPRMQHSRKPDKIREMISQLVGDVPKIELFSRTKIEGWDVWGDQTNAFNSGKKKHPSKTPRS